MREASIGKRNALKHGYSRTPIGQAYFGMMGRCYNPKFKRFKDYGGRGITVCERWHRVENFAADMGEPPEGLTLERENNNGNYEPGNCRWATRKEQNRNTRRNRIVEFGNFRATVGEWAEELGINYETLYGRIFRRHWPLDKAFDPTSRQGHRGVSTLVVLIFLFISIPVFAQTTPPAVLTWQDNSAAPGQEDYFMIESNVNGGAWSVKFKTAPDVITFTDTSVYQTVGVANTFCYRLKGGNSVGESAYSNTACKTYIALPIPPTIPAAPSNTAVK